jgi:hypothetical protein
MKDEEGKWEEYEEKFYKEIGDKYDEVIEEAKKEKEENFMNYFR